MNCSQYTGSLCQQRRTGNASLDMQNHLHANETPLGLCRHSLHIQDSCAARRAIYPPLHSAPTPPSTNHPHYPPLLDDAALIPPRFMLSAFTTHGASDDDSPRRGFEAVPPVQPPLLILDVPPLVPKLTGLNQ
jgi:hypothetical protein